mgnify:CR=1 FL=1
MQLTALIEAGQADGHRGGRDYAAEQRGGQPEMAHGGIGQQALEVVLEDGDEGAEQVIASRGTYEMIVERGEQELVEVGDVHAGRSDAVC